MSEENITIVNVQDDEEQVDYEDIFLEEAEDPAEPDDTYGDLMAVVVAYLQFLGIETDQERLFAGLPIIKSELSNDLLERAMKRIDYSVAWHEPKKLENVKLPFCALLDGGRAIVLLQRTEAGFIAIDPNCENSSFSVLDEELTPIFSGRGFHLRPQLQRLINEHSIGEIKGHWFWSRVFSRKGRVVDVFLASFFANLITVTVSLFTLQVYDRVIPGQSEATLWVLVSGVTIAIVFEGLLRTARARVIDETGKEADKIIAQELFEKLMGMRLDARPSQPGSLVNMIREFSSVREFFTTAAVGAVADLPFVFIFLFIIYSIAGPAVGVIIVGALCIIVPSLFMQKKMARIAKENIGGMTASLRLLTEAAYGLETIKTARAEPRFQRIWEEVVVLNAIKTSEQRDLSVRLTFWAAGLQQATYIAAVVCGVYLVFTGEFTIGAIIAVSILATRTLAPITQLSGIFSKWQNMKAALDGMDAIMNAPQERDGEKKYLRRARMKGLLSFHKTAFAYQNCKFSSFEVEDFKVEPGMKMAILGANGSGKSTFLRLAAGLFQPSKGSVSIDGVDMRQIDPTDVRSNIGFLPQEIQMYRGSLRDNLITGKRTSSDEQIVEALEFAGLSDFVNQHPDGLDLEILDGGVGLSVGQKQCVGLARLYLLDPSVVLMDEPTASLEGQLELSIIAKIDEWLGERTTIITTHRMPILSLVDTVAVMQNGRFIICGPRDEVVEHLSKNSK